MNPEHAVKPDLNVMISEAQETIQLEISVFKEEFKLELTNAVESVVDQLKNIFSDQLSAMKSEPVLPGDTLKLNMTAVKPISSVTSTVVKRRPTNEVAPTNNKTARNTLAMDEAISVSSDDGLSDYETRMWGSSLSGKKEPDVLSDGLSEGDEEGHTLDRKKGKGGRKKGSKNKTVLKKDLLQELAILKSKQTRQFEDDGHSSFSSLRKSARK